MFLTGPHTRKVALIAAMTALTGCATVPTDEADLVSVALER